MTSQEEYRPFFIKNKHDVGIVFVHEFTGSPYVANKIAKIFAAKGLTVRTIRLSGHATSHMDLRRFSTKDWLKEVNEAIDHVKQHCKKVIVFGLSFGGNLALKAAETRNDIEGIVTLETPVRIRQHKIVQAFVCLTYPYKKQITKRFCSPSKRLGLDKGGYDVLPFINVKDILKFMDNQLHTLNRVKLPVLIIQSTKAIVISKKSAGVIYKRISSTKKEIRYLKTANHTNFTPEEIEWMASQAIDFFGL